MAAGEVAKASDCSTRGSLACCLCADIRNWMTQIRQNASSNVNKILIGNKCDVDPSERVRGVVWRGGTLGLGDHR